MRMLALCLCGLLSVPAWADDAGSQADDVATTAAAIDRFIAAKWEEEGITPAPVCDDATYIRRVYLDLTGRIPPGSAVRDFVDSNEPDKRRKLVDELLDSATYIVHYTNLWRAALLPEADADQQIRFFLPGFEAWLRSRLAENRNFAEIADEILTQSVGQQDVQGFNQGNTPTPIAFYRAKEGKPENLAGATARIFMGVRIECAQCHDHPFDDWKRAEFWQYAAFFAEVQPPSEDSNVMDARSLKIPGTEQVVSARYLDGTQPDWNSAGSPRQALSSWLTAGDNPYFARATVNRLWAHQFGVGIVEPLDDFSPLNPPSHPELLDLLAQQFIEHDYDVTFVIRAISASQTYQLSSERGDDSQDAEGTFARMPVRAMMPAQIFDSLAQATAYQQPFNPEEAINFNNDQARQEFLENFRNESEGPTERGSTILQALQLMNGGFVSDATDLADSMTLAAVIDAPFLETNAKIESLFLATLSRFPKEDELEHFAKYVESGGPESDQAAALSDVFWALLNSSEFLTNH